ncbi:MAG: hypothetical protein GQ550_04655, partial [Gammaproteobacteria bacterium]|nr:hypothetical protein [Gammaproteobacteria bacterium]
MPDYDPQSIPLLDDIIEEEKTDETGIAAEEINPDADDEQADDNLDLFHDDTDDDNDDESTDTTIDAEDAEHYEPGSGAIDDVIDRADANDPAIDDPAIDNSATDDSASYDQLSAETEAAEAEPVESALIGYPDEEESGPVVESINYSYDEQLSANFTPSDNENIASVPRVSLESITDTIVDHVITQILPDLEQQLRLLIHQVLEDKLP